MSQPRALVVGLGHMGSFHRRALGDLGFEVHAVDPDPARDAEFRTAHEARVRHGRYDVAAIVVPRHLLPDCAAELVGTPMLVEKPFATNARDALLLAGYLERAAPVCVGFVERFNPRLIELREQLVGEQVVSATFTRWSDKPCDDLELDLLTHDVDLARYLGLDAGSREQFERTTFDVRANQPEKVRRIEVTVRRPGADEQREIVADLMNHADGATRAQSPLDKLWRSFLVGSSDPARPVDAVAALIGARSIGSRLAVA